MNDMKYKPGQKVSFRWGNETRTGTVDSQRQVPGWVMVRTGNQVCAVRENRVTPAEE